MRQLDGNGNLRGFILIWRCTGARYLTQGGYMGCCISAYGGRFGICATLMTAHPGATPQPRLRRCKPRFGSATFEVVLRKVDSDALTYEKCAAAGSNPYSIRSDHYWSVGTAFAVGPETYVTAGSRIHGVPWVVSSGRRLCAIAPGTSMQ